MSTPQPHVLSDPPIPVRVTLAAAWTSFSLLYAYVDILHFYKPGAIADILVGKVFTFEISQTFATAALASVAVPILMITLCATLPARAARIGNLVVGAINIPYAVFNLAGGQWPVFYGLGVVLEVILLILILRVAWTWPRATTALPKTSAANRHPVGAPSPS